MPKQNEAPTADVVMVQLATRIPKPLHRTLKTHCVSNDVSVMDFVVGAIEERIANETKTAKAGKRKAS